MKTVLKLSLATSLFALVCGLAYGQELNNPNNLPPCPDPDYSKKTDIERVGKWHNCWGIYKVELDNSIKGDIYKGEFVNGNLHGQVLTQIFSRKEEYIGFYKNGLIHGQGTYTYADGSKYVGEYKDGKKHGQGTFTFANGDKYVGEWRDGKQHGQGTHTWVSGEKYVGEFKDGKRNGQGVNISASGLRQEGVWENDFFRRETKVNLPNLNNNVATNADRTDIELERQQLAEERRRLEEDKRQREPKRKNERINLQITHTQPTPDGSLTINIQTNADTASL